MVLPVQSLRGSNSPHTPTSFDGVNDQKLVPFFSETRPNRNFESSVTPQVSGPGGPVAPVCRGGLGGYWSAARAGCASECTSISPVNHYKFRKPSSANTQSKHKRWAPCAWVNILAARVECFFGHQETYFFTGTSPTYENVELELDTRQEKKSLAGARRGAPAARWPWRSRRACLQGWPGWVLERRAGRVCG